MLIGIPRETRPGETRVAATPETVKKLAASGKAGERKLTIEFTNDAYKEGEYDRNFFVHAVTLKKVK